MSVDDETDHDHTLLGVLESQARREIWLDMSFGFSIGDFIAVVKLANGLRKQFIGAPRQFEAISQDVKTLSRVLQDVEDLLEHDDDIADHRRNL